MFKNVWKNIQTRQKNVGQDPKIAKRFKKIV